MRNTLTLLRVIISIVTLMVCVQTCALSYETNGFHGFYSIDTVKKQYGEKPLDAIAKIVPQAEMNDSWRSAVAATAFLGADAVPLMDRELTSALTANNYQRASVIFDAYRRILDKRVFSQALNILHSPATPELKIDALRAVKVHTLASHWTIRTKERKEDLCLTIGYYVSISGSMTMGETYSRGNGAVERDVILKTRGELFTLQPELEKQDEEVSRQLQKTIRAIDEKEQQYQDKLAELGDTVE